jgi:hypothetical protein
MTTEHSIKEKRREGKVLRVLPSGRNTGEKTISGRTIMKETYKLLRKSLVSQVSLELYCLSPCSCRRDKRKKKVKKESAGSRS